MARADALILASAAIACAVVAESPLPVALRAPAALALVLYLPGRCVLAASLPGIGRDGESKTLSVALSLALAVLLGLALGLTHFLNPAGWAVGLAAISLAGCFVSAMRKTEASEVPGASAWSPPAGPRYAAYVLACLIAIGAVAVARDGALSHRTFLFTDLWMVPANTSYAMVGVRNGEGVDASYAVDIVARGSLLERIPRFRLAPGEEMTFRVATPTVTFAAGPDEYATGPTGHEGEDASSDKPKPAVAGARRMEARLYKDGDRSVVYRTVWISLSPVVSEDPASRADLSPTSYELRSPE